MIITKDVFAISTLRRSKKKLFASSSSPFESEKMRIKAFGFCVGLVSFFIGPNVERALCVRASKGNLLVLRGEIYPNIIKWVSKKKVSSSSP